MALARLGGERELGGREAERLFRVRRVDTLHLEQHAPGLHHRHPDLRRTLALAHTGLGWLLGERLVGEDAHPHAPAALDVARERDARRLDLARREPAALDGLQAVVAEGERGAAPRRALAAALLHLAPLDLLRGEHDGSSHAEGGALRPVLPGQDLAAEDPHLDADDPVGGLRLGHAVVHVGAQRVQRHAALAVPLGARDLGAAQSARRLDADALRAHAHGARHGLLHGAAERDPPLQLERDVLPHQLRVQVRPPHLVDVEEALLARQLGELLLELLDLGALLPDHDAWARVGGGALHVGHVYVDLVPRLGVGDRPAERLEHRLRPALGRVLEERDRPLHRLPADQVDHQARLLGGQADEAAARARLHHAGAPGVLRGAGAAPGAVRGAAPGAPGGAPAAPSTLPLRSPEWPWKVRVGANSPSLWPTAFSVMNTGMNFRPLCTAKVKPTMSGVTVERRDQVFTTFFSPASSIARTFFMRCASMNGDRKSVV